MSQWKKSDPHYEREVGKYGSALPSREFIMKLLAEQAGPVPTERLHELLGIDEEDVRNLQRRLRAMEREGQVIRDRAGGYGLVKRMDLTRARVRGHRDGYGFAIPEEGGEDLYLHARQMRRVMDGDRVLVRERGQDKRGRLEGVIVEVLERAHTELVGRYYRDGGVSFVTPDNGRIIHDILIPEEGRGKARNGQVVVVEITQPPSDRSQPVGVVREVLGTVRGPGMEVEIALRAHNIPHEWPAAVEREAEKLPDAVTARESAQRIDLRDLPLVTIDGEDARDFDDAVYCEPAGRGSWRLVVAIADVSHYVKPGSKLDREATERGTSVYFPGQVVPMLPEKLSNGLCSLNPEVDRLCLFADMRISAQGKLTRFSFGEGVMYSHARLTYTQVGEWLDSPDSRAETNVIRQRPDLHEPVRNLHALFEVLHAARLKRGAIDFETVETRIEFGEGRKIEQIVPVHRNVAHRIIEECMLCANVSAARFMEENEVAGLYRIHDGPEEEKLAKLREFLSGFSLSLGGGAKPKPAHFQELLAKIEGRPEFPLLQTVLLRSLQQARYSPENIGHFGLAYTEYAHFTSPIRRYPDLLVHRALRSVIRSDRETTQVVRVPTAKPIPLPQIYPYQFADLEVLGNNCSQNERRADEAVRDATDTLKCEYMEARVGETFEGTISAVTGFGFFVLLDDLYVEGLVHVTGLPHDYYHHDAIHHRFVGERSGRTFRLSDRVSVRILRVDVEQRKIDFELAEEAPPEARKPRKPRKRTRRRASKK